VVGPLNQGYTTIKWKKLTVFNCFVGLKKKAEKKKIEKLEKTAQHNKWP